MTPFLEELAARRRFGMKPGLETIRVLCAALGDPQKRFRAIHVAGTNGKGAVCALLEAALRTAPVGRYTSPHLVRINERFFLNGEPVGDATLEAVAGRVHRAIERSARPELRDVTFFEALTAVAFELYAEAGVGRVVLECGLGGRLDATNVCEPELCVITRIGLDHCDWLGDTVERIAAEKAGIVKPGVPVVLGENVPSVRAVVEARAQEVGAPFFYAPDLASEADIPAAFPLAGRFNRENAVTAIAALEVLSGAPGRADLLSPSAFSRVIWPGRFQSVGPYLVDGAHNPPAARALAAALDEVLPAGTKLDLVFGACGDKDVDEVLRILRPYVRRGYAVRTANPRALEPAALAVRMRAAGIPATPCESLADALARTRPAGIGAPGLPPSVLVCGSLFLAGEAIVALGACPWASDRFDPSERLRVP